MLTAANVHDSAVFEELVDFVPPVKGKRGRPRKRPDKLHADKSYGYPAEELMEWMARNEGAWRS